MLYRMNAQSNQLEYAFKRNGIPYRIIGGTRFFDRAEVKDVLAYLCLIASSSDDLRLSRIINSPPRGIGERTVETVRELAGEENCSMFDIPLPGGELSPAPALRLRLRQFAAMIKELQSFAKDNSPDAIFDQLMEKTGYLRALEEKNTVEDTARAERTSRS